METGIFMEMWTHMHWPLDLNTQINVKEKNVVLKMTAWFYIKWKYERSKCSSINSDDVHRKVHFISKDQWSVKSHRKPHRVLEYVDVKSYQGKKGKVIV